MLISIHVPAWGTTVLWLRFRKTHQISIHVPAWGTTADTGADENRSGDFNPRSRVGNDIDPNLALGGGYDISIHVPAWGTTHALLNIGQCYFYFNPRSRVGNDTD